MHGRTRADLYNGEAEYDTIAAIKAAVMMPVFANGDIDSPQKAMDLGINIIYQEFNLVPHLSAAENEKLFGISTSPGGVCAVAGLASWR